MVSETRASAGWPRPDPVRRAGKAVLKTAVVLAGAALANRLVARSTERRHPPAGRFVEVDGVRLHLLDRGSGPSARRWR